MQTIPRFRDPESFEIIVPKGTVKKTYGSIYTIERESPFQSGWKKERGSGFMADAHEREFDFTNADFEFLVKLVHEQTGIVLGDHKRDMVYSRLARRLRQMNIPDFASYCNFLAGSEGDSELGNLVNAITTNLTAFFRELHHFDHLASDVLKPMANDTKKRLRIWSAGCSIGAEPYSIAMTVHKAIPNIASWDAKILATDIDTNVLNVGIGGIYSMDQFEKIPAKYHEYVKKTRDDKIEMSQKIRDLITFKQLNLLHDWPVKGPFDVIFCRNVVIYFNKDTQRALFDRYANLLKPGGLLYIGHSENLFNVCDRFESMGRTIYRKLR